MATIGGQNGSLMNLVFFLSITYTNKDEGVVLVMIIWSLDLQLPVQSMPITTKVVSSNPVHDEVH
jgi:hypothetical protein